MLGAAEERSHYRRDRRLRLLARAAPGRVVSVATKSGSALAGQDFTATSNSEEDFVNLRPALEMGVETAIGKSLARWYARLGINRFIEGGTFGVQAMLEGAPDDAGYFDVNQSLDRTVREVAAGVDVLTGGNVTLRSAIRASSRRAARRTARR